MAQDCKPRMLTSCEGQTLQSGVPPSCSDWSVCLPFAGRLYSEGGCVKVEPGNPPEDGVYGKVIIAGGCIVGLEKADIPLYTSSPCAPVPAPCACGEGGSMPEPSPQAGNLFTTDAAGMPLVKVSMQAGSNISITGSGTTTDPFIISGKFDVAQTTFVQAGNSGVTVTGTGGREDPYKVGHGNTKTNESLTSAMGLSIDQFGHITAYNAPAEASNVKGVVGGDGIEAKTDAGTGLVTLSLTKAFADVAGEYDLGGYHIKIDAYGRVTGGSRDITIPAGEYVAGDLQLTLNEYGSVTGVSIISSQGIVTTSATKQFSESSAQRSMTFTTMKASSFRITYTPSSTITGTVTLYVDSQVQPIYKMADGTFQALTTALYGAGEHTITVSAGPDSGDNTLNGTAFLDVVLVVAV